MKCQLFQRSMNIGKAFDDFLCFNLSHNEARKWPA
jgi:hypothetical protein